MESIVSVAAGVGLAAACGFRVFVPMLALSAAGLLGLVRIAPGFEWIATPAALLAFAIATALEIAAYKIPWLDHALDALATPAAVVAGMVVVASVAVDLPPVVRWTAILIGGGGAAGVVQGATVLARFKSSALTLGLGNPLVSMIEAVASALTSLLSILVPFAGLALAALFCGFIFFRAGRILFGHGPRPHGGTP